MHGNPAAALARLDQMRINQRHVNRDRPVDTLTSALG